MSKLRDQVREFHRVFEHPTAEKPTIPSDARVRLRLHLIAEEFTELMFACFGEAVVGANKYEAMLEFDKLCLAHTIKVDLPEVADALADLDYVVEGMRLEFSIDGGPIADEVHAANLRKIGGGRRADGKTAKPSNWTPPDIAGELRRQGWNDQ
jgi:predicted HAD superfamily Cof-like phosphohydrolase